MIVFMARIRTTHEIVGFFWAKNIEELYWEIDECCDPNICEYKKLTRGSLMFENKTSVKVPMKSYDDEEKDELYRENYWLAFRKDIDVSEATADDMSDDRGWKTLEFNMDKVYDVQGK